MAKRLNAKQRLRRKHLRINITVAALTAIIVGGAGFFIRYDEWLLLSLCLGSAFMGAALTFLIPQLLRRGHGKPPAMTMQPPRPPRPPVVVDAKQLDAWMRDEQEKVTYRAGTT